MLSSCSSTVEIGETKEPAVVLLVVVKPKTIDSDRYMGLYYDVWCLHVCVSHGYNTPEKVLSAAVKMFRKYG